MKDLVALNLHMIVTIVDGGTGEDVIDFSKEAGAAGGTILHGRGSGVHDSGKFLGLDISPEKDVVLTLVPDSLTNQVMDAIGQGINIDVPGNGICFSIDVDKEGVLSFLEKKLIKNDKSFVVESVKEAIEDAYKRLIEPSIEREIRSELTEKAEDGAIKVFGKKLKEKKE